MPLEMRNEVFITAAITGSGGTQNRSDLVPRSPKQIAEAAIEAARAGGGGAAVEAARAGHRSLRGGNGLGGSTGVVRADFTTPPDWTP